MSEDALMKLWEAEQRARRFDIEFWRVADELLDCGLVTVEDIAVIYGLHPSTCRKRLQQYRDRVPLKLGERTRGA